MNIQRPILPVHRQIGIERAKGGIAALASSRVQAWDTLDDAIEELKPLLADALDDAGICSRLGDEEIARRQTRAQYLTGQMLAMRKVQLPKYDVESGRQVRVPSVARFEARYRHVLHVLEDLTMPEVLQQLVLARVWKTERRPGATSESKPAPDAKNSLHRGYALISMLDDPGQYVRIADLIETRAAMLPAGRENEAHARLRANLADLVPISAEYNDTASFETAFAALADRPPPDASTAYRELGEMLWDLRDAEQRLMPVLHLMRSATTPGERTDRIVQTAGAVYDLQSVRIAARAFARAAEQTNTLIGLEGMHGFISAIYDAQCRTFAHDALIFHAPPELRGVLAKYVCSQTQSPVEDRIAAAGCLALAGDIDPSRLASIDRVGNVERRFAVLAARSMDAEEHARLTQLAATVSDEYVRRLAYKGILAHVPAEGATQAIEHVIAQADALEAPDYRADVMFTALQVFPADADGERIALLQSRLAEFATLERRTDVLPIALVHCQDAQSVKRMCGIADLIAHTDLRRATQKAMLESAIAAGRPMLTDAFFEHIRNEPDALRLRGRVADTLEACGNVGLECFARYVFQHGVEDAAHSVVHDRLIAAVSDVTAHPELMRRLFTAIPEGGDRAKAAVRLLQCDFDSRKFRALSECATLIDSYVMREQLYLHLLDKPLNGMELDMPAFDAITQQIASDVAQSESCSLDLHLDLMEVAAQTLDEGRLAAIEKHLLHNPDLRMRRIGCLALSDPGFEGFERFDTAIAEFAKVNAMQLTPGTFIKNLAGRLKLHAPDAAAEIHSRLRAAAYASPQKDAAAIEQLIRNNPTPDDVSVRRDLANLAVRHRPAT